MKPLSCFIPPVVLLSVSLSFFLTVSANPILSFPDCVSGPLSSFPICDSSLSLDARANDLISRLNVSEKIGQLGNTGVEVPRLGVPSFQWWNEALHGVAYSSGVTFGGKVPYATSFPMPIGLSAAFNRSLIHTMASMISTEARAFSNVGQAGLTYFTPNINIYRDPRWGRGQETPGEDPYTTAEYVYALITGLQEGEDPRYLKIAADCKHFNAYDMEDSGGTDRFHFNAVVSDQDMVDTLLPPFESCVRDAHVASIMCSYNSVNGIPSCANSFLLETIAREQFKLDGFVVSDCNAIGFEQTAHHYSSTVQDTVANSLHAGCDLNCGYFYQDNTQYALGNGTIVEADIDNALRRLFRVLIRLGYFDAPQAQPYRNYGPETVNTPAAQQLALEAAHQSIVLLKNNASILPLDLSTFSSVAVIGPSGNATQTFLGNYNGLPPFIRTIEHGLRQLGVKDVWIEYGCDTDGNRNQTRFDIAASLTAKADVTLFVGGLDAGLEGEGNDRGQISLPGVQWDLVRLLESKAKGPVIFIAISGGQVDLTYARDSPTIPAVLWAGYPGQAGGDAIADVLFGRFNPAGRLPVTQYAADFVNQVSMLDMNFRPTVTTPGRTYRFYTGKPVYEFGAGLSYTTFRLDWETGMEEKRTQSHSALSIDDLAVAETDRTHVASYRVRVTNTGSRGGDEVVMLFVSPQIDVDVDMAQREGEEQGKAALGVEELKQLAADAPIKQLIGFDRVHLCELQMKELFFGVTVRNLLNVDRAGSHWLLPGQYVMRFKGSGPEEMRHTIRLEGKPRLWSKMVGRKAAEEKGKEKKEQVITA